MIMAYNYVEITKIITNWAKRSEKTFFRNNTQLLKPFFSHIILNKWTFFFTSTMFFEPSPNWQKLLERKGFFNFQQKILREKVHEIETHHYITMFHYEDLKRNFKCLNNLKWVLGRCKLYTHRIYSFEMRKTSRKLIAEKIADESKGTRWKRTKTCNLFAVTSVRTLILECVASE